MGSGVELQPGIEVDAGAIVVAWCVVTKSAPVNTTVVGNPAKPIIEN